LPASLRSIAPLLVGKRVRPGCGEAEAKAKGAKTAAGEKRRPVFTSPSPTREREGPAAQQREGEGFKPPML
jgi:hypothetical protein